MSFPEHSKRLSLPDNSENVTSPDTSSTAKNSHPEPKLARIQAYEILETLSEGPNPVFGGRNVDWEAAGQRAQDSPDEKLTFLEAAKEIGLKTSLEGKLGISEQGLEQVRGICQKLEDEGRIGDPWLIFGSLAERRKMALMEIGVAGPREVGLPVQPEQEVITIKVPKRRKDGLVSQALGISSWFEAQKERAEGIRLERLRETAELLASQLTREDISKFIEEHAELQGLAKPGEHGWEAFEGTLEWAHLILWITKGSMNKMVCLREGKKEERALAIRLAQALGRARAELETIEELPILMVANEVRKRRIAEERSEAELRKERREIRAEDKEHLIKLIWKNVSEFLTGLPSLPLQAIGSITDGLARAVKKYVPVGPPLLTAGVLLAYLKAHGASWKVALSNSAEVGGVALLISGVAWGLAGYREKKRKEEKAAASSSGQKTSQKSSTGFFGKLRKRLFD